MAIVQVYSQAPQSLIKAAQNECSTVDWLNLPFPDLRPQLSIFNTSSALHLRVHKAAANTPHTVHALSEIIDCVDTPVRNLFPGLNALASWVCQETAAECIGRIMVVRLLARGSVAQHIDPGKYFQFYYRFHVPIFTNEDVYFYDEENSRELMPQGFLCQLYNQKKHGVINNSGLDRIHLIIDLRTNRAEYRY